MSTAVSTAAPRGARRRREDRAPSDPEPELAVAVVLLQRADRRLVRSPLGDAGGGGQRGGDRRDARRPCGGSRRGGCASPSARGPRPRGVFTTRSTLPDEMSSTASAPPGCSLRRTVPGLGTVDATLRRPLTGGRRPRARPRCRRSPRARSPSSTNRRPATRPARLSRSASERNTVPATGSRLPARGLALREGEAERAVDAHDLAGRAHLGSEQRVDVGEPVERQHRFLHRDVAAVARRAQQTLGAQLGERRADHHPGGDLGERHAGRLAHERHRPAGAGVRLDHEDLTVLDRVLHVEQAANVERVGERVRVRSRSWRATSASSVGGGIAHAESPECTPASSMCSMTPPMSTSPVASRSASTSTSIASSRKRSISAGRSAESPPSRPRVPCAARARPSPASSAVVVVHDLHRAPAEHVRRADQHRVADRRRRWPPRPRRVAAVPPAGCGIPSGRTAR